MAIWKKAKKKIEKIAKKIIKEPKTTPGKALTETIKAPIKRYAERPPKTYLGAIGKRIAKESLKKPPRLTPAKIGAILGGPVGAGLGYLGTTPYPQPKAPGTAPGMPGEPPTPERPMLGGRIEGWEESEAKPGGIHRVVTPGGGETVQFQGLGQSINLTPEQAEAFSREITSQYPDWQSDDPQVNAALQAYMANKTAGMGVDMPIAPDIEQRNIWASTFREGLGAALSKGVVGAAAGAIVGGIPGAIVGFIGTTVASIYGSYVANQKEEVKNAYRGFQGLKSSVAYQITALRAGAMSPAQLAVNMQYAEKQLDYYIGLLRQKQAEGGFIADVSDYDGRMAYMMEFKILYFSAIKAQSDAALRQPGYMPQEVFIPPSEYDIEI